MKALLGTTKGSGNRTIGGDRGSIETVAVTPEITNPRGEIPEANSRIKRIGTRVAKANPRANDDTRAGAPGSRRGSAGLRAGRTCPEQ